MNQLCPVIFIQGEIFIVLFVVEENVFFLEFGLEMFHHLVEGGVFVDLHFVLMLIVNQDCLPFFPFSLFIVPNEHFDSVVFLFHFVLDVVELLFIL